MIQQLDVPPVAQPEHQSRRTAAPPVSLAMKWNEAPVRSYFRNISMPLAAGRKA